MTLKEKAPGAGDAGTSKSGHGLGSADKSPKLKGQAWKAAAAAFDDALDF
jgi:hypothetical protein